MKMPFAVFLATSMLLASSSPQAGLVWAQDTTGTCVIIPDQNSNAQRLGKGVIVHADSVCDAVSEGCGTCLDFCQLFININDRFGCPPCAADSFCNPTCAPGPKT